MLSEKGDPTIDMIPQLFTSSNVVQNIRLIKHNKMIQNLPVTNLSYHAVLMCVLHLPHAEGREEPTSCVRLGISLSAYIIYFLPSNISLLVFHGKGYLLRKAPYCPTIEKKGHRGDGHQRYGLSSVATVGQRRACKSVSVNGM